MGTLSKSLKAWARENRTGFSLLCCERRNLRSVCGLAIRRQASAHKLDFSNYSLAMKYVTYSSVETFKQRPEDNF